MEPSAPEWRRLQRSLLIVGVLAWDPSAHGSECTLGPGPHADRQVLHEGALRSYSMIVPSGCDPARPFPLLVELHSWDVCPGPEGLAQFFAKQPFAEEQRIVLVRPVGSDGPPFGGAACGPSHCWSTGSVFDVLLCSTRPPPDDVAFLRAVVADVGGAVPIDERRIYAYGESMGGGMAHRAACGAPDLFAAVAATAFPLQEGRLPCAPDRPVSVLYLHGIEDNFVWYDRAADLAAGIDRPCDNKVVRGDGVCDQGRAPASFARWAELDGCLGEPVRTFAHGRTRCDRHMACAGDVEVEFCSTDAGHGVYENPDGLGRAYVWTFLFERTLPIPEPRSSGASQAGALSLAVLAVLRRWRKAFR
ncbi:MAG: hypothetical protein OZ948_02105 [Deltaproteobacteria bacterium]|nr:hypothetical protein [Deltaproteobacteria bacterium]